MIDRYIPATLLVFLYINILYNKCQQKDHRSGPVCLIMIRCFAVTCNVKAFTFIFFTNTQANYYIN